jgi:sodium/hydrogen antiporter
MHGIVVFAFVGLFLYSLASRKAQEGFFTPPLVFTVLGLLLHFLGLADFQLETAAVHSLAELTLILILFSDASRIDLGKLRKEHSIPVRLLAAGLPLTILLGALVGKLLLPGLSWGEVALLSAILAPTDAALGQAVVSDIRVPVRIRQALNVESGLNDGLALPFVLMFLSLSDYEMHQSASGYWLVFGVKQVTIGPLVGAVVAWIGCVLLNAANGRGWMDHIYQKLAVFSLSLISFSGAEALGGNGFIAAFVAGMVTGSLLGIGEELFTEFAEDEASLLTAGIFFILGALAIPLAIANFRPVHLVYAICSLTFIRMIPVSLSLLGSGLHRNSHIFLGWFGPRGLASFLYAILIVEQSDLNFSSEIITQIVVVVVVSIVLHAVTAHPGAAWYAATLDKERHKAEMVATSKFPLGGRTRSAAPEGAGSSSGNLSP